MSWPLDDRLEDVKRLVHEYLSAAMIMVPLEPPLDSESTIADTLAYLDQNSFDLAIVDTPEIRVVLRDDLARIPEDRRHAPIKQRCRGPRRDRLIEHGLALGDVGRRLAADPAPLLVVGREGPQYIVTRADFTRSAGQAGALAVFAALDSELDQLLRPFDTECWSLLSAERQAEIETLVSRAVARDEEVHRLSYLSMGERLVMVRQLELPTRLEIELGSQADHELVVGVRNSIAHGREVESGLRVIEALEAAERVLDAVASFLESRGDHRTGSAGRRSGLTPRGSSS